MADIWFISDTHFFHDNILTFKDDNGKLIRDFSSVEEMNETLVEQWNSRIAPQDRVYHLGDVALGVKHQSEFDALMRRLHGHKRLLLGNHDNIAQHAYRSFERIELWTGGKFKQHGFVACHIPLRHDQMRGSEVNVHGHIHANTVTLDGKHGGYNVPDPRYINVCVEHTGYAPVHLDEIIERVKRL